MKRKLPSRNRDLKIYVLRRRMLQLAGFAIWLTTFGLSAWLYNDAHQTYPPQRRIVGWRLVLWMTVAAVIGFFLFRLWKLFTQRGFEGTVIRSGLSHSYTPSGDPGAGSSINYDFRLNTYLLIRTEKGKKRRIRFEQKPGFYLYYYPGTHLCGFSGLPYPIRDPHRACAPQSEPTAAKTERSHDDLSGGYLCVACGLLNRELAAPCDRCGHSLVDPKELWMDSAT